MNTASGVRDLVFVFTQQGHIIAMDAHTGATIWSHQNANNSCLINNIQFPCYTTASPVIDPNRQYVYSYGLDGKVHKLEVRVKQAGMTARARKSYIASAERAGAEAK